MTKRKLVVLTGAGISAESGIRTFRDMGGLWEEYDVMEVASPDAWERNPDLVLRFYNERRKQLLDCKPNEGHLNLVKLEEFFNVNIITQNVDDLHERAGSKNILHLHGELKKVRSSVNPNLIYDLEGWELKKNQHCELGSPLRPHIVWFGEEVPLIADAALLAGKADVFLIVGTSLNVYPAAGLIDYVPLNAPVFLIDPEEITPISRRNISFIREKAGKGTHIFLEMVKKDQI